MPARPKPDPTVLSLINDKIDGLGTSLTGSINAMREDLGGRISELSSKVQTQNGRIGKVEIAHGQCQIERRQERVNVQALTRQRMAALGGGGLVSGAAIVKVLEWLAGKL